MQLRLISWVWVGLTLVLETVEVRASTTQDTGNKWNICITAVKSAERLNAIPLHLLNAISKAESGRWHTGKKANIAWPWTVNANGAGKFFDTKAEAVAEVEFLMTEGVRNIDVGCMQINLKAHANAFATIGDALDPPTNAAYGAKYLKTMYQRTNNWLKAAGGYHSMTPHLNARYRAKVGHIWNKLRRLSAPEMAVATREGADDPAHDKPETRSYRASEIDHERINRLNQHFRQRRELSADRLNGDFHDRRANARRQQIAAWRNAQARGQDLSVLAGIRQAESAKRRQRNRIAFGKQELKAVFAQRRRQQLNDWRARFDK